MPIKSFQHKGLEQFFLKGSKAGIQAAHASKLSRQLARLNVATSAADMNLPGWGLHPLKRDLAGHYAVEVNGNWRLTFTFDGVDAVLVDYLDYH
jgi:proteic killer suppression protein